MGLVHRDCAGAVDATGLPREPTTILKIAEGTGDSVTAQVAVETAADFGCGRGEGVAISVGLNGNQNRELIRGQLTVD